MNKILGAIFLVTAITQSNADIAIQNAGSRFEGFKTNKSNQYRIKAQALATAQEALYHYAGSYRYTTTQDAIQVSNIVKKVLSHNHGIAAKIENLNLTYQTTQQIKKQRKKMVDEAKKIINQETYASCTFKSSNYRAAVQLSSFLIKCMVEDRQKSSATYTHVPVHHHIPRPQYRVY